MRLNGSEHRFSQKKLAKFQAGGAYRAGAYKKKRVIGQMIRLCGDSLVLPLRLLFSNMLRTSSFPSLWKLANVTPVFKKNDKQLVKNYRPISLLPLLSKIFEKILFNKIYEHLTKNNLITANQYGFVQAMVASINYFIL